jgi:hypothetical protein
MAFQHRFCYENLLLGFAETNDLILPVVYLNKKSNFASK